jgi:hypothetical protein
MPKNQSLIDAYFRFLTFAEATQELPSFPRLDAVEGQLLQLIVKYWRSGRPLSVTEAIQTSCIGSPATLHSRLKKLRSKRMIELRTLEDARCKQVVPTPETLDYFISLGECMQKATATLN